MNLPKLTKNLDIITSLPDQPTETPTELKVKFDEAGNEIKDFINDILISGIQTGVANDIESAKTAINNNIDGIISRLKAEINGSISSQISSITNQLNNQMNSLKNEINQQINGSLGLTEYKTANFLNSASERWQRLFKRNKIVHIFIEGGCNVGAGQNQDIIQLPEGFIPGASPACRLTWGKTGDGIADRFGGTSTVHIMDNGRIAINGGSVGIDHFIIEATYVVN